MLDRNIKRDLPLKPPKSFHVSSLFHSGFLMHRNEVHIDWLHFNNGMLHRNGKIHGGNLVTLMRNFPVRNFHLTTYSMWTVPPLVQ